MIFDLFVNILKISHVFILFIQVCPVWLRYPIPAAIFTRGKSIMIPDFSRTPPSLNDRTKRGEASALRSQAVAKGLMVLPWQLLRAYCCTPLVDSCSLPLFLTLRPLLAPRFLAWHILRASCACTRMRRISECMRMCVARCVHAYCAFMHLCQWYQTPWRVRGQCPEFKDEGSSCWILIRMVNFSR